MRRFELRSSLAPSALFFALFLAALTVMALTVGAPARRAWRLSLLRSHILLVLLLLLLLHSYSATPTRITPTGYYSYHSYYTYSYSYSVEYYYTPIYSYYYVP